MTLSISVDQTFHRADSSIFPIITTNGMATVWSIKIADWIYLTNPLDTAFPFAFPNRTMKDCPIVLRQLISPTWTLDAGVTGSGTGPITSTGSDAWKGAYFNTALSDDICSIEGIPGPSLNHVSGLSLQNSTNSPIQDDPTNILVAHAMTFTQDGRGVIRELGQLPPKNAFFKWELGQKGMIEKIDGVVRYYLIDPDGTMHLLRTTRSKLTTMPKAEVAVYSSGSTMSSIAAYSNNEVSTEIETIGVLENFQDWFNDFLHVSTADPIQMADNVNQWTYPNAKKRLRTLSANLNMRQIADRHDFLDFWQYHGSEKAFIFVDNAHKDRAKEATEFFAVFSSPFGDKARGSCLSAHAATITEDYRDEYFPKLVDTGTPTLTIFGILPLEWADTGTFDLEANDTAGELVKSILCYVDGVSFGSEIILPMGRSTHTITIDTSGISPGTKQFKVRGIDFAGHTAFSNELTIDFLGAGGSMMEIIYHGGMSDQVVPDTFFGGDA